MREYKTRHGDTARVFMTDGGGEYPVIGAVRFEEEGMWSPIAWAADGIYHADSDESSPYDLMDYPEPKTTQPLGPDDVPPGSLVRHTSWPTHKWDLVTSVRDDGVYCSACFTHWEDLAKYYQIKRPGEDWKPCHK